MTTGLAQMEGFAVSPRFGCNCAVKPESVIRPRTTDVISNIQLHFKNPGSPPSNAANLSTKVTDRAKIAVDRVINCFVTSLAKSNAFICSDAMNSLLLTKRPQATDTPTLNKCTRPRFGKRLEKPDGTSLHATAIQKHTYVLHFFICFINASRMLFILLLGRITFENPTRCTFGQILSRAYGNRQDASLSDSFHQLPFNIVAFHASFSWIEFGSPTSTRSIDRFFPEKQLLGFLQIEKTNECWFSVVGKAYALEKLCLAEAHRASSVQRTLRVSGWCLP